MPFAVRAKVFAFSSAKACAAVMGRDASGANCLPFDQGYCATDSAAWRYGVALLPIWKDLNDVD